MPEQGTRTLENYSDLPEAIQDFIFDTNNEDTQRIVDAAGLSGPALKAFFEETKKVYLKKISLLEFAAALKTRLSLVSDDKLRVLVSDFIGYRFLPVDDFLDGQPAQTLMAMGINPSVYDVKRIVVRAAKPLDLVTEFLHEHPVNVPAHLEQRMREILESRVRGVRKDDDTITRLTRAEKIGGVELPREEAKKLVEALAAKAASVNIASDNDPPPVAISPAPTAIPVEAKPRQTEVSLPKPVTSNQQLATNKSGHGFTPEDEHEANAIREKVLPNMITSAVFDAEEEIKRGVGEVFDATEIPLSVPLEDRYKAVVASRLKGVRDAAETRDLLVRETAKGGLGFSAIDAEKVSLLIEKQAQAIGGKREATVKNEKTAFVKGSVDATFAKDESRKKGELEELDRMYSSLTGKVSKTPAPVAPQPVVTAPVPALPKASAPIAPLVPTPIRASIPAPVPAAAPAPTVLQPVFRASLTASPAPITPPAPPRPIQASPVAVIPSPKMQDVRPVFMASNSQPLTSNSLAARLTGPVQELANLTLADFRRLSADPAEACRKITDKLDVLEEHAYTQRIAGIKAWQGSAVYKLYLEVINAAFSGGKPIAAAIAEAMSAGLETPTEREIRAIMELNRQLKA